MGRRSGRGDGEQVLGSRLAYDSPFERDRGELPQRVVSARVSLRQRLAEIWSSRELLGFLVRKELKVRYKNSVLGFLWSFLNPALVLLVYYVVFKYFLENHIDLFAIYLFAGLLPWNLFNNSLLSSAGVLVAQAGIVKKVAFPREILALAQVGTSICYFFFQACIMVCFLVGFGVMPDWKFLPVVLLAFACDVMISAALAVFLSAVTVYLRDVQHLIEVLLVAGFFSAPIVYMFTTVGTKLHQHGALWVYFLNPLVTIVLAFQRFIYGTVAPKDHPIPIATYGEHWYLAALSVILLISVALFMVAMVIFGRVEGNFAEEL
jgi:ABC-2 type transport system permease protein